jgi:predicted branched-subunit amino acid permease
MSVHTAHLARARFVALPKPPAEAAPGESPQGAAGAFLEGARDALPVGLTFFLAFLGVGAVFEVAGLGVWPAGLSTLLLMAGPAQVSLVEGAQAGQSLLTLLLAVAVINGRYLLLSAVPAPAFEKVSLPRLLLALTFMNASTFAVAHGGLRRPGPASHPLAFFWGVALAAVLPAVVGTMVGFYVTGLLPPVIRATVEMILPINFVILLARDWPKARPLLAAGLGFLLTPPLERLLPGGGMLLAAVLVGLVVGLAPLPVKRSAREPA